MELIINEGSLKNIVDGAKEVVNAYKDHKKGDPEVHDATQSELEQSPEAKELFDKFTGGTKKSVKAYSDFANNKIVLTVDVSKLPPDVVSLINPKGSKYSKYFTKYDKDSHSATYEFPVDDLVKGDDVEIKDRMITSRGGDIETEEESVMVPTPTPYKLRLVHRDGSYLTDEEISQWLSEDLQMSAPKAYMNNEDYPYLKVTINGKDYSFEMKDDSPYSIDQMQDKILKMQKYSLGKALQFMKKNMLGTRMESLEESPAIEAPDDTNTVSVVDIIKNAYDEGKFGKLPCVGRRNACQIDISGVDKDRLISFFDKKKEFNREDHNEAGINSVEFISDKFDVEVFDSFIQIYIIPQYESVKRMTVDEFSNIVNESLKESKNSFKDHHICQGCGKPLSQCTCEVEGEDEVDESFTEAVDYKIVEYNYDGDDISDYLGHVRVRTNSDKVALRAAEKYAMSKHPEDNPGHFKIVDDNYTNVDVIDSDGDYLTTLESVDESNSVRESSSGSKYVTRDIINKTDSQKLKDAYDKGELEVLINGDIWYTERCPKGLGKELKAEMKRLYPDIRHLYGESVEGELETRKKNYLKAKEDFETLGEKDNNDVLSREEKMLIAKAEYEKVLGHPIDESLNEGLSPQKGDRVRMDHYSKSNNGQEGTVTGRIGELCSVTWDDGTKSKEIKGYLTVIERDGKVVNESDESLNEDKCEEDLSGGATQPSSIGQHKVGSIDLVEEVGQWKELDTKQVPDSDGFSTDYTLYTNGDKFVCIFGDKEVYLPDDGEFDYETEDEDDAREWFKNYEGLGDES